MATEMVNFMYQLGWAMPRQIVKVLFLGVSMRVILEEISIWFSRQQREPSGRTSSNPLRAWIQQKGGGRANTFSAWAEITILSTCMLLLVLFLWRTLIQMPITPPLPTHQCHSAQWDLESDSPSPWIRSAHVICFIYGSDNVLTLSLTFKKAGCFGLGAPRVRLPYKKLKLDYW